MSNEVNISAMQRADAPGGAAAEAFQNCCNAAMAQYSLEQAMGGLRNVSQEGAAVAANGLSAQSTSRSV